ncbi:membrane protein FAM174B-like [Haliotis rubra]|uniref:membrane protein FAM174B-like n=1 Tax=Haliotis rubra TaxID=36100 RepID=UPI001EE6009F|nr:membrane protein FAM174B-like [Haliotis rubra]
MEKSTILIISVLIILLEVSCASLSGETNVNSVRKSVPEAKKSVAVHETTTLKVADAKTTTKPTTSANETCLNSTDCTKGTGNGYFTKVMEQITKNKDMLLRTMYVLIGVTGIVIIYFVVRAWRLRSRRRKARKYGIITTPASDLEMAPLGQGDDDDDDEDMTVFEMNGKRLR